MKSINEPRLAELAKQVEGLEQRHAEQQATVVSLWRELEQAREHDLNAEAKALSSGARKPKPKAPDVERALKAAEHDLEVIGRAVSMAQSDVSRFYSEHYEALMRELMRTKTARANEVADHARPLLEALRGFYDVDDDAKVLRPYQRQPVETGPPGTGAPEGFTLILAGANTTQKAFGADKIAGLHRGELEGVIATLANLPASFAGVEERESAA